MQDELDMKEKLMNLFAESELKMDPFLSSLKEQQEYPGSNMVHTHSTVCTHACIQ